MFDLRRGVFVMEFRIAAKITSMKHSVAKGDKKQKKEVAAEIEKLENDMKIRHEKVRLLDGMQLYYRI